MLFWFIMLIAVCILPFTMVFLGGRLMDHTPERESRQPGYRTARAMRNHHTWNFAQHYLGYLWHTFGALLLPISVIPMFPVVGKSVRTVALVGGIVALVQCIPLFGVPALTERALKRCFDEPDARDYEHYRDPERDD